MLPHDAPGRGSPRGPRRRRSRGRPCARGAGPCRRGAPAAAGRAPGRAGSRRTAARSGASPPRMFTITVHGSRACGEPSGRSSTARRWFSNWLVTEPSWVQWPVLCGRIASSLTSTRPSRVSNSSTASTPVTPSSPASRHRDLLGLHRELGVEVGSRGDHLVADAVALRRGDDRPRGHLARGRARDQGGQLAAEVDPLLGQDRHAGGERLGAVVLALDEPDALAVVPAAGGLQDARPAERRDLLDRGDQRVARARHPELGQPGAHHALVLGVHERLRPGAYGEPRLQRVQVLGRHVLVVEGDHLAALGDPLQRRQVAVVADQLVGDDLGRRDARRPRRAAAAGCPCAAAGSAIIRASWPPPMTATVGAGGDRVVGHAATLSTPSGGRAGETGTTRHA